MVSTAFALPGENRSKNRAETREGGGSFFTLRSLFHSSDSFTILPLPLLFLNSLCAIVKYRKKRERISERERSTAQKKKGVLCTLFSLSTLSISHCSTVDAHFSCQWLLKKCVLLVWMVCRKEKERMCRMEEHGRPHVVSPFSLILISLCVCHTNTHTYAHIHTKTNSLLSHFSLSLTLSPSVTLFVSLENLSYSLSLSLLRLLSHSPFVLRSSALTHTDSPFLNTSLHSKGKDREERGGKREQREGGK